MIGTRTLVTVGAVAAAASCEADIDIVDRQDFVAGAGGARLVDPLDAYTPGPWAGPLVLSNGLRFGGDAPYFVPSGSGQVLINNSIPLTAPRTFSGFGPGATRFGAEVFLDGMDEYDLEVVCSSGDSLRLTRLDEGDFDGFLGVVVTGDALLSVTLRATGGPSGPGGGGAGISNYAFDNLETDVPGIANPACLADLDFNGALNVDDLDAFGSAFLIGQALADVNGSVTLTVDDIDAFVGAFLAGCP